MFHKVSSVHHAWRPSGRVPQLPVLVEEVEEMEGDHLGEMKGRLPALHLSILHFLLRILPAASQAYPRAPSGPAAMREIAVDAIVHM